MRGFTVQTILPNFDLKVCCIVEANVAQLRASQYIQQIILKSLDKKYAQVYMLQIILPNFDQKVCFIVEGNFAQLRAPQNIQQMILQSLDKQDQRPALAHERR